MKVSELEGAALDYWVAKAEGWKHLGAIGVTPPKRGEPDPAGVWCLSDRNDWWLDAEGHHVCGPCCNVPYDYSTDWSRAGPIIGREKIGIYHAGKLTGAAWKATVRPNRSQWGTTPLLAAMRCFVASKFGETVGEPSPQR